MPETPADLKAAIATEPLWLQGWVMLLVLVHLLAVVFLVRRGERGIRLRPEPAAILLSFLAAGAFMSWLYAQVGYVRLLGLAHIFFWGPVWAWILSRRRAIGWDDLFGRYVHVYLVVAGISLAIDAVDVVRHLLGDGELLHRWS